MEGNEQKKKYYKKKDKNYNNKRTYQENLQSDNTQQIIKNKENPKKDTIEKEQNEIQIPKVEEVKEVINIPNLDKTPKGMESEKAAELKQATISTLNDLEVKKTNPISDSTLTENKREEKLQNDLNKDVVEDYVADIFNTPYAKQSIQNAVNNKKGNTLEDTTAFTETIVSNEIKEKLQEMKEKQIRLEELQKQKKPPKKNHFFSILLFLIVLILSSFIFYHFKTYNHKIKEKIITKEKIVKVVDENYVFLGDSITEKYDIEKHYKNWNKNIVNSGISGNLTKDILNNMKKRVYDYNPSVVFLLIGVNDVNKDVDPDEIIDNIKKIITNIRENRNLATLYVESIYPTGSKERNDIIIRVNKEVEKFCNEKNITYIDLYKELVNKDDVIDGKYTKDGIHLSDEGYKLVTDKLKPYIKEEKK